MRKIKYPQFSKYGRDVSILILMLCLRPAVLWLQKSPYDRTGGYEKNGIPVQALVKKFLLRSAALERACTERLLIRFPCSKACLRLPRRRNSRSKNSQICSNCAPICTPFVRRRMVFWTQCLLWSKSCDFWFLGDQRLQKSSVQCVRLCEFFSSSCLCGLFGELPKWGQQV